MRPMLQASAIGFGVCLVLGTGCGDVGDADLEQVDAAYTFRDCAARFDACDEAGRAPEVCRAAYARCIDGVDEGERERPVVVAPELSDRQCWRDFDVCTEAGVTPERCRARLGRCLELVREEREALARDDLVAEGDERPCEPPRDERPTTAEAPDCERAFERCVAAGYDERACAERLRACEADAPR